MFKLYRIIVFACVLSFTTLVNGQDYSKIIKDYINTNKNKSLQNIQSDDISDLVIKDIVYSKQTGVTHVYAFQKINDIEIYNSMVNATFKDGEIIYLSHNLETGITSRTAKVSPRITPLQAASNASISLGLGRSNFIIDKKVSTKEFTLSNGGVSLEEVPVKLVYQVTKDNSLKLAWDLSIYTLDEEHWYSVRVDAITGELLDQYDGVMHCTFDSHHDQTVELSNHNIAKMPSQLDQVHNPMRVNEISGGGVYNVFPMPIESPNHGINRLVMNPHDPIASPLGWHDTDGIAGAEFTITRGNNTYVYEDRDGNSIPGASADGGEDLSFYSNYNFNAPPINSLDANMTNLFYWNNIMHDVFYQYGFDEESGNFQVNNYGNAGLGEDAVEVQAQRGGRNDVNDARIFISPDGTSPTMRMNLWGDPNASRLHLNIVNEPFEGSYLAREAAFGPGLPTLLETPIVGSLVVVEDDNSGSSTDANDACDSLMNSDDLEGNIAVIRRGTCTFDSKVFAAQNAGATAVIIVNNVPGDPFPPTGAIYVDSITIPSIMISQANGEDIISLLGDGNPMIAKLQNRGPYLRDSALDNGVVAHEYGHGITVRLTGGPSTIACSGNRENMNEGWSDYFGLMMTMTANDAPEDARGVGTYILGQPVDGPGIRRTRQYSTDFAVNDLTHGDLQNLIITHDVGSVWTTMLWDMTWDLIDEYGFDSDLYNGTGGNNIALQLVVDGLKLQPCRPGFVDGRDAILAAVEINRLISDNQRDAVSCIIWNAFANRGLGFSAQQNDTFTPFDNVEAFDLPSDISCQESRSSLSVNENDLDTVFSVFPNPSNGDITVQIAGTFGEGQIQIYDINGREVYNTFVNLEGNISVNATGLAKGVYIMNIKNDVSNYTSKLIIE
ncbi:peptidase M36 [Dokdonia pacifica]|uniref:Por secretion system C-terminal sorting domain-containing protein n=1 Tax=Dokdonia pacifica TaxID=1627892 RepID=A0A239AUE6_9FLAO|nr:T9SS-dependent M36 family metallopeptidase [Dokdonia pacifica]GGG31712.1 peptidase M36 [Dokdonia pacifica]SNR98971.1 Por secretion system C-terminal sorting domain-containing protein [Dokdonia pacifica]